jgi:hypothetical protein
MRCDSCPYPFLSERQQNFTIALRCLTEELPQVVKVGRVLTCASPNHIVRCLALHEIRELRWFVTVPGIEKSTSLKGFSAIVVKSPTALSEKLLRR